ncbi:MAG: disulfide bond formation protein B [Rhodospirillaceae bacterium]|nr:disulfide bond formation protein B [Rhodospirillaceae bacterium]|tara:strand:- start:11 stop:541 length:531 start_codon:yes stop_codon:yes gene_type:complete
MAVFDKPTPFARRPHFWPAFTFLASAGLLGGAWAFEVFGGLQPCPLCVYQRWPYWIMIGLAGLAVIAGRRLGPRAIAAFAAIGALVFLAGAGVAGFHVGVEQHWWAGLSTCGGTHHDPNLSIEELKAKIFATPLARCDDVPWSLFGISLAGYNLIVSLILAAVSAWATQGIWRKTA